MGERQCDGFERLSLVRPLPSSGGGGFDRRGAERDGGAGDGGGAAAAVVPDAAPPAAERRRRRRRRRPGARDHAGESSGGAQRSVARYRNSPKPAESVQAALRCVEAEVLARRRRSGGSSRGGDGGATRTRLPPLGRRSSSRSSGAAPQPSRLLSQSSDQACLLCRQRCRRWRTTPAGCGAPAGASIAAPNGPRRRSPARCSNSGCRAAPRGWAAARGSAGGAVPPPISKTPRGTTG